MYLSNDIKRLGSNLDFLDFLGLAQHVLVVGEPDTSPTPPFSSIPVPSCTMRSHDHTQNSPRQANSLRALNLGECALRTQSMPKRTNMRERLMQALESQNPIPFLLGPPGALGAEGGRGVLYSGNPKQGSSCSGLRVILYREGFDSADPDA